MPGPYLRPLEASPGPTADEYLNPFKQFMGAYRQAQQQKLAEEEARRRRDVEQRMQRKDDVRFGREQTQDYQKVRTEIDRLSAEGRFSEAKALNDNFRSYDPETNQHTRLAPYKVGPVEGDPVVEPSAPGKLRDYTQEVLERGNRADRDAIAGRGGEDPFEERGQQPPSEVDLAIRTYLKSIGATDDKEMSRDIAIGNKAPGQTHPTPVGDQQRNLLMKAASMSTAQRQDDQFLTGPMGAAGERYKADKADAESYPQRHAAWQQAEGQRQDNKTIEVGVLGGGSQKLEFNQLRKGAWEANAKDWERNTAGMALNDHGRLAASVTAGEMRTGLPREKAMDAFNKFMMMDAQQLQKEAARVEAMKFKVLPDEQFRRAQVIAHIRSNAGDANAGLNREKFETEEPRKDQAAVLRTATAMLNQRGFKGDFSSFTDLKNISSDILVRNGALDELTGARFAHMANGAGVLTDADYQKFWVEMGGVGNKPWTNVDDAVNYIFSGEIPQAKRDLVAKAIAVKFQQKEAKLGNLGGDLDRAMEGLGYGDTWQPMRPGFFGGVGAQPPTGGQMGRAARGEPKKRMTPEEIMRAAGGG